MHKIEEPEQLEEFRGSHKDILIHFVTEYMKSDKVGAALASCPGSSCNPKCPN